jgi:hypothetical protein
MRNVRSLQLDELLLRPGTYFNPQTEIMIVVDDSPEVDNEIFEGVDLDASEWVLIADEAPVDEHQRDELIERFHQTHRPDGGLGDDDPPDDEDVDLDPDEDEEDDEVEELDPLEFGGE